jgi:hypothetical protein
MSVEKSEEKKHEDVLLSASGRIRGALKLAGQRALARAASAAGR